MTLSWRELLPSTFSFEEYAEHEITMKQAANLPFEPEDKCDMFLRNVGVLSPDYT
jgi:hypothetical protein